MWVLKLSGNPFRLGKILLDSLAHTLGPLLGRMMIRYLYPTPAHKWRVKLDQMRDAIAFILHIITCWAPGPHRPRLSDFPHALYGAFIHTNHRIMPVKGPFINV